MKKFFLLAAWLLLQACSSSPNIQKLGDQIEWLIREERYVQAIPKIDELERIKPQHPKLCEWIQLRTNWYKAKDFENLHKKSEISFRNYCK